MPKGFTWQKMTREAKRGSWPRGTGNGRAGGRPSTQKTVAIIKRKNRPAWASVTASLSESVEGGQGSKSKLFSTAPVWGGGNMSSKPTKKQTREKMSRGPRQMIGPVHKAKGLDLKKGRTSRQGGLGRVSKVRFTLPLEIHMNRLRKRGG